MNAIAFDTHKYVKRLVAAGMPEAQAEAIADEQRALIEDPLATKHDFEALQSATKRDLEEFRSATKRDLEEFRSTTKRDLEEYRSATNRDLKEIEERMTSRFDTKLIEMEQRMTLRLGAMLVASIAAVAALVKLL